MKEVALRVQANSELLKQEFSQEQEVQRINSSQVQVLKERCETVRPRVKSMERLATVAQEEVHVYMTCALFERKSKHVSLI